MARYKTFKLSFDSLESREMLDASSLLPGISLAPLTAHVSVAEVSTLSTAEKVLQWNQLALDAIRTERTAPPLAARNLAMVSVAVFEAMNGITRQYASYYKLTAVGTRCSIDAALATTAHKVLVSVFPNQKAIFDAELQSQIASTPAGLLRIMGVRFGNKVGDRVLADRSTDGSSTIVPYTVSGLVGRWEPTPPAFVANPLLPQWGSVKPFAIGNVSNYLAVTPPSITSSEYADALNEVKSLGSVNSATRTADQTEIAFFWAAGAGTVTPPGMWNVIATQQARSLNMKAIDAARTLAILNVAMADAGIASWKAKYTYDYWRPVTAIRKADLDGNTNTEQDATWSPLLATPPFPSYTSGHSTFSAAAATVLTGLLGNSPFGTTSEGVPNVTRNFTSYQQAAHEASLSRIYGGIHFNFDSTQGEAIGNNVGQSALARFGVAIMV